jgi:diguanylate cyclase (GGDEF)-like protein
MSANIQKIIQAEKLSRMLAQNTRSVASSTVLGCLLVYTQAHQANTPLQPIYIWSAVLVLISLVRIFMGRYFFKHPTSSTQQIALRLNALRAGVILTSICWGANVYLVRNINQLEHLFFFSFLLAGISSGAVVSYAIDKISAVAYLFFAVTPLVIYELSLNTPMTLAMALATTMFIIFMFLSVKMLNQYLIENIVLRVEAQERDEQIRQMAFHDVLTGLPNRRALLDKLSHALAMSKRNQTGGAVLFIDLDHFKTLNDTHGHDIGDLLLQQVAIRLKEATRESDTVARLGGDEFIVMLENLSDNLQELEANLNEMMKKILHDFNRPYLLKDITHFVSPSIGAAVFGQDGNTPDDLLKHADVAMYEAKRAGRKTARLYKLKQL